MSIWKKLFGGDAPPKTPSRSEALQPTLSSTPPPSTTVRRDEVLRHLEEYWAAYGDANEAIKKRIVGMGVPCLQFLKDIALDYSVEVNTRKAAIVCISAFGSSDTATFFSSSDAVEFIGENFVFGKTPSSLHEAYESGRDRSGFPLYLQATESIEEMGYRPQ